jgi:hypothetical protein
MLIRRGTLRHPKFSELVETISARCPRVARIIEGAIWEIERNPKGLGVYIEQVGVWQARLVVPSSPDLLIFYTVAPRFVTMLTIVTSDGSPLS